MALRLYLKTYLRRWMVLLFFVLFIVSVVMIHTLPWVTLENHKMTHCDLRAAVQGYSEQGSMTAPPARPVSSNLRLRTRLYGGTSEMATEKARGRPSSSRVKTHPQQSVAHARGRQASGQANSSSTFISIQPLPAQVAKGAVKPGLTFVERKFPARQGAVKITCSPDGRGSDVHDGKVITPQQSATKAVPPRDFKKKSQSQHTGKKSSNLSARKTDSAQVGLNSKERSWCKKVTESSLLEKRNQGLRSRAEPLPWLSEDDIQKLELLSGGKVVSKARVPAHGQVLQVGLDGHDVVTEPDGHRNRCQQGFCALIKRTDDWFEVFAFHLDRVLGLNRSLPAVSRRFHSDLLPYRYTSGTPRPIVWWDPGILHLVDGNNDQNSFPLTWLQYQALLKARCDNTITSVNSTPCIGVHHSEWGRLALFDFLLQVNDRLDRYCCGFEPDPSEPCVDNQLHTKCGNPKDQHLVHILVRKADPSRLVFIDNAGRPYQSHDNLNFLLVEGIDEFPESAVSVLKSGCLEAMLLQSLYTDQEFWDSQGGLHGLRPLIHTVDRRAKILLQHIRDQKLRLNRDL